MTFSVDFYAGKHSANCAKTHIDGTNTRAAWDGYVGGPYTMPASLTPAAMGGAITPTLSFFFTG